MADVYENSTILRTLGYKIDTNLKREEYTIYTKLKLEARHIINEKC